VAAEKRAAEKVAAERAAAEKAAAERAAAERAKAAADKAAADKAAADKAAADKAAAAQDAATEPQDTFRAMLERLAIAASLAISGPVPPPSPFTPTPPPTSLAASRFMESYNKPERRPDQLYALMTTDCHRLPERRAARYSRIGSS
jgi:hypothetical protein